MQAFKHFCHMCGHALNGWAKDALDILTPAG